MYSDHGAVCSDQHDGDISGSVVVTGSIFPSLRTTGSYKLTYDCSNSNDRHALTANRKVLVRDTHCPVCRIRPGIDTVEASFPFADAGVICNDSLDGLLKDVVVTSTVNVEKTGQYYVTYHVRDSFVPCLYLAPRNPSLPPWPRASKEPHHSVSYMPGPELGREPSCSLPPGPSLRAHMR